MYARNVQIIAVFRTKKACQLQVSELNMKNVMGQMLGGEEDHTETAAKNTFFAKKVSKAALAF